MTPLEKYYTKLPTVDRRDKKWFWGTKEEVERFRKTGGQYE